MTCMHQSRRCFFACLAVTIMLFTAGCKCIQLDCRTAPAASLELRGLEQGKNPGVVRMQSLTLDIPVTKNVKICAGYEILSGVQMEGTVLAAFVNGKPAITIEYGGEGGKKVVDRVIDDLLLPGKNEIDLATITYNANFFGQLIKTRAGCVILADGKKIVEDCFNAPDQAYEIVQRTYALSTPGGGPPGQPHACAACQINRVDSRWVIGIDPTALGANGADERAVRRALIRALEPALGAGATLRRYSPGGRFAVISDVSADRIQALKGRNWVRFVEPDHVFQIQSIGAPTTRPIFPAVRTTPPAGRAPNDPLFSRQPYLPDINAPAAWDAGNSSADVLLAVVDTGAAWKLADLEGQVTRGQDFACDRGDEVCDGNGHGTHVAGTMIAKTNNGDAVAGVAWTGNLLVIRALDDGGGGTLADVCDAIRFAVDRGAKVVSLSLGMHLHKDEIPPPLVEVARYAHEKGVVLVCAAGNSNNDNDGDVRNYPSSLELPNVIGVLATNTSLRTKSVFSNYGPRHVHIAAPGTDILNLFPTGGVRYLSGTSMATPQVAAALAMCWNDLGAELTVQQRVKKFLSTYTREVPALNGQCEQGRFLQLK